MNTVELLGHYGGDREHAMSAWTSTEREYELKEHRMPDLLKFLADRGHHTPFEKSALHFLVRCETASHIHLLKHRIGVSINGESARYKELGAPTFHIPEDWPENIRDMAAMYCDAGEDLYHKILRSLVKDCGFTKKRAKESARFVLPYANQLTLDVSFNFRSFMHFLSLRLDTHAQDEIAGIASDMLMAVRDLPSFHHSLLAFGHR